MAAPAGRRVRFQDLDRIRSNAFLSWVMDTALGDDEAPKDPGAMLAHQPSYTEKDFQGHRAHSMYVGVHLPGGKRHSRRHHHKHHRANGRDATGAKDDDRPITPPAQRVQFILGEDVDDGTHEPHPLFSEMGELVQAGDEMEWKETARWIKFEEDVEEGGNRWSKPHVATLSLHSLLELRSLLLNGAVLLDMDAASLEQVVDLVLDNVVNAGGVPADARDKVREALLRRHRHQHERRKDNSSNMSRLPIIRSLAEIGRNHSSSKNFHQDGQKASQQVCRSSSCPTSETALLVVPDHKGPYLMVPGTTTDLVYQAL